MGEPGAEAEVVAVTAYGSVVSRSRAGPASSSRGRFASKPLTPRWGMLLEAVAEQVQAQPAGATAPAAKPHVAKGDVGPLERFRRKAMRVVVVIVEHRLFEWATVAVIAANCVTLALYKPLEPNSEWNK